MAAAGTFSPPSMIVTSVRSALSVYWRAASLMSRVALFGVPFFRPPRRSPGFDPRFGFDARLRLGFSTSAVDISHLHRRPAQPLGAAHQFIIRQHREIPLPVRSLRVRLSIGVAPVHGPELAQEVGGLAGQSDLPLAHQRALPEPGCERAWLGWRGLGFRKRRDPHFAAPARHGAEAGMVVLCRAVRSEIEQDAAEIIGHFTLEADVAAWTTLSASGPIDDASAGDAVLDDRIAMTGATAPVRKRRSVPEPRPERQGIDVGGDAIARQRDGAWTEPGTSRHGGNRAW